MQNGYTTPGAPFPNGGSNVNAFNANTFGWNNPAFGGFGDVNGQFVNGVNTPFFSGYNGFNTPFFNGYNGFNAPFFNGCNGFNTPFFNGGNGFNTPFFNGANPTIGGFTAPTTWNTPFYNGFNNTFGWNNPTFGATNGFAGWNNNNWNSNGAWTPTGFDATGYATVPTPPAGGDPTQNYAGPTSWDGTPATYAA